MEATAQLAASHMALGYKLLSMTALHKNEASQLGVLMSILGGKAGDVAATVTAALLPASGPRPSSAKDNKQGPRSVGGSFRKLFLSSPSLELHEFGFPPCSRTGRRFVSG